MKPKKRNPDDGWMALSLALICLFFLLVSCGEDTDNLDGDAEDEGDCDGESTHCDGDTGPEQDGDTPPADGDIVDEADGDEVEWQIIDGDTDSDPERDPDMDPDMELDLDCDEETMDGGECAAGFSGYPDCHTDGFVAIEAGSFWIGSPQCDNCPESYTGVCERELCNDCDEMLHQVELTYNFELDSHELSQGDFESLMGYNPSTFSDSGDEPACGADCPVETVSWHEALAYANALSKAQGLTECFDCSGTASDTTCSLNSKFDKPQDCDGYRLPTEAEWEYAIRVGEQYTAFYQSDKNNGIITQPDSIVLDPNLDKIAWYGGNNTPYGPKPVGGKAANAWGLYDMSGNVWEWTWDWYKSDYETDVAMDPIGPDTGSHRVRRGGGWFYYAHFCRSAQRCFIAPNSRLSNLGFRLARSIP